MLIPRRPSYSDDELMGQYQQADTIGDSMYFRFNRSELRKYLQRCQLFFCSVLRIGKEMGYGFWVGV